MRLSNSARQNNMVGEMVNLMAVDAQKFVEMLMFLPQLLNAPLTFTIGLYLLWGIIGPSCLAGLAILVLIAPINAIVITLSKKFQVSMHLTFVLSQYRAKLR